MCLRLHGRSQGTERPNTAAMRCVRAGRRITRRAGAPPLAAGRQSVRCCHEAARRLAVHGTLVVPLRILACSGAAHWGFLDACSQRFRRRSRQACALLLWSKHAGACAMTNSKWTVLVIGALCLAGCGDDAPDTPAPSRTSPTMTSPPRPGTGSTSPEGAAGSVNGVPRTDAPAGSGAAGSRVSSAGAGATSGTGSSGTNGGGGTGANGGAGVGNTPGPTPPPSPPTPPTPPRPGP
jgi:hypothetical protein